MTERFVVPEPSESALGATKRIWKEDGDVFASDLLRAAYAVDVPVIVRQEVERALDAVGDGLKRAAGKVFGVTVVADIGGFVKHYPAARFGAAPEHDPNKCRYCGTDILEPTHECRPTPSAPAVVSLDQGRLVSSPVYTDAERDFLRASAAERLAFEAEARLNPSGCLGPSKPRLEATAAVMAAARRVVEEGRRRSGGLDG